MTVVEDQPDADYASPVALSLGYAADSDIKEDSKDVSVDYLADGGDEDDDDDSSNDEEDEEEEALKEEEHQAPTEFVVAPAVDPVPSFKETEPFEMNESTVTPPPPTDHTTPLGARISIRLQESMPFLSEAKDIRLLALPTPPPFILLSPPSAEEHLARCLVAPSLPSSLYLPPPILTSSPLPSPQLPASLFIPPPVDRESSNATPRPIGDHREDYGFIGTLDAETRRQRVEEVSYGIRDVWVDPTEAVEE
nr:hypothetical protein [Tanacetum cinerariifolium]